MPGLEATVGTAISGWDEEAPRAGLVVAVGEEGPSAGNENLYHG